MNSNIRIVIRTIIFSLGILVMVKIAGAQMNTDSFPRPVGTGNDFEHIFSESEKKGLEDSIQYYFYSCDIIFVIVTIDSSMASKESFNQYVLDVSNKWGVGKSRKNNGILIGISKGMRIMRIQYGDGISKRLSDEKTQEFVDKIFIPFYKKGEFYLGTIVGMREVASYISQKK